MSSISDQIWRAKYRFVSHDGLVHEDDAGETLRRVVNAAFHNDRSDHSAYIDVMDGVLDHQIVPAGRILTGLGTPKNVTSNNCFVMDTLPDDMDGIMRVLSESALTMQMGGGIGVDFSTLRPKGALLMRTHAEASGPLPFMDMWDGMCKTIMSSGERRGAMMFTLRCDHPDIFDFIEAKHTKGRLTNANLSVLITADFIDAVKHNRSWELGFPKPMKGLENNFIMRDGEPWYVYKILDARDLWDKIMRSTYKYSEPGVIFIDRINDENNLQYCETLATTNPCGEQPLPPYGACLLGAVNLAKFVKNPWTESAAIDYKGIEKAAELGVHLLDNILDVSNHTLDRQSEEALDKRRIGLGVMGLASLLQQCGIRYGSDKAVETTKRIFYELRGGAYAKSIDLAKSKGPFPAFTDEYLKQPFIQALPHHLQIGIAKHGIRNGVILTVAPTGTTAMFAGNVSSGIEPVFAHQYTRNFLQADGSLKPQEVTDWGWGEYCKAKMLSQEWALEHQYSDHIADYMVTTEDLTVEDHLEMQAAAQKYIDASISKTINCPPDISFEDFKEVYWQAYEMGCKGCTTYRPSDTRGAVLETKPKTEAEPELENIAEPNDRLPVIPDVLPGMRYKFKPGNGEHAFYVNITDIETSTGRVPAEIFITTKHQASQELAQVMGRILSAIFRRGGNVEFIAEELQQIAAPGTAFWMDGQHVGSASAGVGLMLQKHIQSLAGVGPGLAKHIQELEKEETKYEMTEVSQTITVDPNLGSCPNCQQWTLAHHDGCEECLFCGYTKCG